MQEMAIVRTKMQNGISNKYRIKYEELQKPIENCNLNWGQNAQIYKICYNRVTTPNWAS